MTGTADMSTTAAVALAIEQCRAKVRAHRSDMTGLTVLPSDEEIVTLSAQGGYVATIVAPLQELQSDPAQSKVGVLDFPSLLR
ncbi:hypothetical protein R70006_03787 [Paraburkholderia domus]|nr:hypothetical protein R70006_03787 [Paraburkholderia domus]